MAPSPFFSGRIPKDLHSRIEQYLEETGKSKTQLLVSALSSYLDYPVQPDTVPSNLLEDRLSSLEKRVEEMEKSFVEEIKCTQTGDQTVYDNKPDNISDNDESKKQPFAIEADNSSDSMVDNTAIHTVQALEPTEEIFSEDDYDYIGKYHVPEILEFKEFHSHDKKKIKNKLRNANTTKTKTALIPPYFFRIIGKEEGNKGQLIYDTYHLKSQFLSDNT